MQQSTYSDVVGVSDELLADFKMLREVEYGDNEKYHNKTVDKLAMHIVCRHYGNLCYELAHFNWAIIHAQGLEHASSHHLLNYYWVEGGHTPANSKRYFLQSLHESANASVLLNENASITIQESMLDIQIYAHRFSVHFSRVNLLACFMEWLICLIPNFLERIEMQLLGKSLNAIKDFASELQKTIYLHISKHLPAAKLQQRYRKLNEYFNQHELCDEHILACWQTLNKKEGFTKYSGMLYDTFAFLEANALCQSQRQLSFAEGIDSQSAISLHEIEHNMVTFYDAFEALKANNKIALTRVEAPIKALNKKQLALLALIAEYPRYLHDFARSFMRCEIFGKHQHQVIQASRNKKAFSAWPPLEQNYTYFSQQSIKLIAENQQTLMAIVHVLLPKLPIEAGQIMLKLSEQMHTYKGLDQNLAQIAQQYDKLNFDSAMLISQAKEYPLLAQFLGASKSAFKQINRHGFTGKTIVELEHYVKLAETLFDINSSVKTLVKQIKAKKMDNKSNFEADRHIFFNEFKSLHAQDSHE